VDALVQRILQAEDFPAFSRVMSELMASLSNPEASAQRLANLVLRDYAMTVKVIRAANSAHYNRSGRPVQSATHALMLLGARNVRDLASALLLFEHYRGRSSGLKELMLLSLLTASHAREASLRVGAGDPEAAQLCGMFRNLGEVLVAAHLPGRLRRGAAADARRPRRGAGAQRARGAPAGGGDRPRVRLRGHRDRDLAPLGDAGLGAPGDARHRRAGRGPPRARDGVRRPAQRRDLPGGGGDDARGGGAE
jgi:hypothetical protein